MNKPKKKQNQASEFTLPIESVRKVILAAGEITNELSLRNRTLVALLYWAALRREEVATLDMRDINHEMYSLTITGKGSKQRTIPLRPELISDLRILLRGRSIPADRIEHGKRIHTPAPVFASARSNPKEVRAIDPSVINRVVKHAAIHAGVKSPNPDYANVWPHLFRHSFGRHWLDAGRDLRVLSYLMGHESISTTVNIYGTPSQEFITSEYLQFVDLEKRSI